MDFEDRHVTVTPEGISLDVVLAGLGSRFVAFLIDFTLQVLALIGFTIVVVSAFHGSGTTTSGLVEGGAFSLFVLVDFIGYFIFCEMLFNGRSLGKRAAGLRVVRVGSQPVGFWSSLLRNVLRLIDMQLGFTYLVGSVLILSTSRNQRLGDLIAGTLVVRERVGAATTLEPLAVDLARRLWEAGLEPGVAGRRDSELSPSRARALGRECCARRGAGAGADVPRQPGRVHPGRARPARL